MPSTHAPTREFPADVLDAGGAPIRLGSVVRILSGPLSGAVGEAARWVGPRGVEVIVPGSVPELVAVPPFSLERLDAMPILPLVRPAASYDPDPEVAWCQRHDGWAR